jgi:hypothetical protein
LHQILDVRRCFLGVTSKKERQRTQENFAFRLNPCEKSVCYIESITSLTAHYFVEGPAFPFVRTPPLLLQASKKSPLWDKERESGAAVGAVGRL